MAQKNFGESLHKDTFPGVAVWSPPSGDIWQGVSRVTQNEAVKIVASIRWVPKRIFRMSQRRNLKSACSQELETVYSKHFDVAKNKMQAVTVSHHIMSCIWSCHPYIGSSLPFSSYMHDMIKTHKAFIKLFFMFQYIFRVIFQTYFSNKGKFAVTLRLNSTTCVWSYEQAPGLRKLFDNSNLNLSYINATFFSAQRCTVVKESKRVSTYLQK
jgi:hypothetical protein